MRVQLALNVADLEQAITFYSRLFGTPVHKRRPGYANFAIDDPPLKLVLFERAGAEERLNHLGVEVFRDEDVSTATERFKAAAIDHRVEGETHCCHATQNKVWAREPEGLRWEWYRITDDTDALFPEPEPPAEKRRPADCCAPAGPERPGA